jgi:hypothetical protein
MEHMCLPMLQTLQAKTAETDTKQSPVHANVPPIPNFVMAFTMILMKIAWILLQSQVFIMLRHWFTKTSLAKTLVCKDK